MATAIPFTTQGVVTDPRLGDVPPYEIQSLIVKGTGTVYVHDGADATGPLVLAQAGAGIASLETAVTLHVGLYVEISGAATGSILTS